MPNQRYWCFTSYEFPNFETRAGNNHSLRYVIFGRELCPTTQRTHYQGYCEFSEKVSMKTVKIVFNDDTMHLEPRYGSQEQAINYCMKDGDVHEWGEPQYSGKRNDLKDVINECKTIGDVMDNYPHVYCAYRNGLKDIYNRKILKEIPLYTPVDVYVYVGPTGTGKTRKAIEENAGKYYKLSCSGNSLWFDGYDGQEVLIIDEFYGWIKWNYLLQLLDVYPVTLPIKGGFVEKQWKKVIITSNKGVHEWYPNVKDISALQRRIKEVIVFGNQTNSKQELFSNDFIFDDEVPDDFHIEVDNDNNNDNNNN